MTLKINEDVSLPIYEDEYGNGKIYVTPECLADLKQTIRDMIDEEMVDQMLDVAMKAGLPDVRNISETERTEIIKNFMASRKDVLNDYFVDLPSDAAKVIEENFEELKL